MAASPDNVAAADAIPRDYNFADDLFRRFRDKGWLDRVAYIDPRGRWTYLGVFWDNAVARRMYEALGFRTIGEPAPDLLLRS